MQSTDIKILNRIKKARRGKLFFPDDFARLGNAKAISKALQRLVERGEIDRVARGIYAILRKSALLGKVHPGIAEIAKAIARRDRARIVPTGAMAQYLLGLSTQIPLKVIYLTDSSPRAVNIGDTNIRFKKSNPRNLAAMGEISSLVIQALRETGKQNLTEAENNQIVALLKKENPVHLVHDIRLAPEWIRIIMKQALPAQETK